MSEPVLRASAALASRMVEAAGIEPASETDYWGASYREGMEWLAANYALTARAGSIRVANTAHESQTAYYIRSWGEKTSRFVPVALADSPHVVLSTTRWNLHEQQGGKVVHIVERGGVPLLFVIEVRPPA